MSEDPNIRPERATRPTGHDPAIGPNTAVLDLRDAHDYARARPIGAVRLLAEDVRERAYLLPPRHRRLIVIGGIPETAASVLDALRTAERTVEHLPGESWRETLPVETGPPSRTRLWEPATVVVRAADRYRRSRPDAPAAGTSSPPTALDLACGSGRNAVYLAECGFDVKAIDRDVEALARARDLAERHGVMLRTEERDLEAEGAMEGLCADLIVVVRFLERRLFAKLPQHLAPGGILAYETFTVDQAVRGHPRQSRFLLEREELRTAFPDLETLEYEEDEFGEAHLARLIAQRPPRNSGH